MFMKHNEPRLEGEMVNGRKLIPIEESSRSVGLHRGLHCEQSSAHSGGQMFSLKAIAGILVAVLACIVPQMAQPAAASADASGLASALGQAAACTPATDVGGIIFRDYNVNGVYDDPATAAPTDTGPFDGVLSGVQVPVTISAYGPTGALLGTTTQDASGAYNLGAIDTTGGVRLEFTGLPGWVQPGPFGGGAGTTSGTLVQFTSGPTCSADLGVNNPDDYCDANPGIATSCLINGDPLAGGNVGDQRSLVAWNYALNGWWFDYDDNSIESTAPAPDTLAISSQMGATWGIAYQRSTQTIFSGALMKRHSGFGPLGTGGIYATDYSDPNNPVVTNYLDLNSLPGVSTGTDPHSGLPANVGTTSEVSSYDPDSFDAIGKIGLGDLDISEDGSTLYVVNLFSRELLSIDIATKALLQQIAIPNPGCMDSSDEGPVPAPEDVRPWALKVHDGQIYLGVTCSAQTSQSQDDLHAYVLRLEGNTLVTHFDMALDFVKGRVSTTIPNADSRRGWFPWTDDFYQTISNPNSSGVRTLIYPQPILSDIEVDDDGSLILGFIDRVGHQGGRENRGTDLSDQRLYNAHSGGDILRVCNVAGTLVLEGGPGCDNSRPPEQGTQGPNGGEFYYRDDFSTVASSNVNGLMHNETTLGALALLPGSGEVVSTHFDAVRHYPASEDEEYPRTGGVRFFNNETGEYSLLLDANGNPIVDEDNNPVVRAYEIYPDTEEMHGTFAKAAGLGDLELLCDAAPVEIGNYVWLDSNANGVQDPNELPLSGVVVELVGPDGTVLATATTDANGQYYFSSDAARVDESTASIIYGVPNMLLNTPGYQVRVPLNQVPLAGLSPAAPNATGDASNDNKTDLIDSDGLTSGGFSVVTFAIGPAGANNHNLDFGFTAAVEDIFDLALRKTLAAGQPEVVTPGDLVNFTIEVFNQGNISASNIQVTDYLDTIWTLSDPDWTLNGNVATTTLPGPLAPGESTTVDITLQLTAAATPGEYDNFAEISQATDDDNEPRVDIDSTPDQDRENDCNPQDDVIDQDGKNNPCTEDEDDHDFARVRVPTMSLGNRVWLDTGLGGGTLDNGIQETGEPGIANVQLSLLDGDGNPVLDGNNQPVVTTTQADGYYLFDNLVPGDYRVCVDAVNFAAGNPLEDLRSSTPTEEDPDADVDLNDNGLNRVDPATTGICSGVVTLAFGDEPTNETDAGPLGSGLALDADSNLTVDFGFIPVDLSSIFDLALRKTLATGQNRVVIPEELVTFTIEVFNQGEIAATNITVVDYVPEGLTLEDPNWVTSGDVVSRTISGPLQPGASTTVDIIFRVNEDVPPGDIVNLAEISRATDEEGQEPEDIDSTPDDERDNDCNPQDNEINEDGKNNPCDEDEDDHDFEVLQIPSMSLGNRVWIDDGAGGGGANNGLIDGTEEGVPGVKLNLLDENGNPVLDEDGMPRMTTTVADGYFLFDDLPPGEYIVCVDPSNFDEGAPLDDLLSSGPTEEDPDANEDLNDNGINDSDPAANGICSGVVTLVYFQEPVSEPDQGLGGSGGATDDNSNITVDFGFVRTPTNLDEDDEPVLDLDNTIFIPWFMQ